MFSAVSKRTVDTRWRSGIHSNLALSLPVAYEQGTVPESPKSAAPAPAPKAAAVKSEVANLRFGYKTRTYAVVVGGETLKTGPADAPLGCLLMCMNTRLCTLALFNPTPAAGQSACTAYGSFTRIDADKPDGHTVIFKE